MVNSKRVYQLGMRCFTNKYKKVYAFGPKQQLINHGIVLLAGVGDLN